MAKRGLPRRSENEALQAYLRELGRLPRLTPGEERDLGARIRATQDDDAIRRLVEGNLRFVVAYAKRYRYGGVSLLDLIHAGNLGLIEAARRYDPDRNVKFITYAVWWIRQAIVQELAGQSRAYSLPAKVSSAAARFGRGVAALASRLERAPSAAEIADDLDLSAADVARLQQVRTVDVSLNEPRDAGDGDPRELAELIADADRTGVEDELTREALVRGTRRALTELDEKEREVMRLRFGLDEDDPKTLQEIGDRLGLSRERVRQIEARARDKLRRSKRLQSLTSTLN